jgi:asparagine synthetase B (glutamine-hydrolysing)
LGRDDRCIADHGREAWFPYLDEDLVAYIQQQPLSHLIDLTLPPGVGDKQVLRQAAAHIGLEKSAQLVKRAIQFGSLASKQTSVSYFGSRRKGKGTTAI